MIFFILTDINEKKLDIEILMEISEVIICNVLESEEDFTASVNIKRNSEIYEKIVDYL